MDGEHGMNAGPRAVPADRGSPDPHVEQGGRRRELVQLKWLSTVVPGAAVLLYETVRYEILEHLLPGVAPQVGNTIVAVLVLLLTYAFASFVFRVVERVRADAVRLGREVAALHAVMDERARLSRELHDGLAQLVAFLLVRLDTVADLVQRDQRAAALGELERLRDVADDLYVDVRETIAGLRSRVAERGLVAALRDYVDEFDERYGLPVTLETEGRAPPVPDLVGMQLFRVVQEALANVRKHARARRAWVRLRQPAPDRLELEVGDDGVGFDPTPAPRAMGHAFGLASMRERADALGGTLRVETAPGSGTRVLVTVPLEPGQGQHEEEPRAGVASAAG
jgi:two-component system, NarL family, sensor histidine kinase DegS